MKVEGLEGEWELVQVLGDVPFFSRVEELLLIKGVNTLDKDLALIRRVPEKSKMEKWVISSCTGKNSDGSPSQYSIGDAAGRWEGFRKAIKQVEEYRDHICSIGDPFMTRTSVEIECIQNLISELRKFTGEIGDQTRKTPTS